MGILRNDSFWPKEKYSEYNVGPYYTVISRVTTPFVGYDPMYPLIRPTFYVCFKLFFSMTEKGRFPVLCLQGVLLFFDQSSLTEITLIKRC